MNGSAGWEVLERRMGVEDKRNCANCGMVYPLGVLL